MTASALLLLASLSFASSIATATTSDGRPTVTTSDGRRTATTSDGRRADDVDIMTLPELACDDTWSVTAFSANVTEGQRWEFGYPDFSNRSKFRVAVQSCSSATQRSIRVGPFASRAGGTYDITTALIDSFFSVGDRITRFRALPVTHLGEPVGYPPLYVHHIHVGRLTSFYDEHWFTTHGDFSIGNDFGIGARSTKGYTTHLANGYSFTVDCRLPFAAQAIIQDMRSIVSAPELSIFIEVNFGLALHEAALEPATLVWNEAPHGPFGYSRFAVLDEPSMSWWTMRWPASGALLPSARLHSHYARHHRLFLIDEAPQKLAFFSSHVNGIVRVHDSIQPTSAHETMRLSNLSHTEQTLSRLPSVICQDDANTPSSIQAATREHPNASLWARYRDFVCRPHKLLKGRISTFVQLYRPVADPDVRLYPMHTNTWFYIQIPEATSSTDIKTVSYRYATYRTRSILEPVQDEAIGSCEGKPSPAAVASYVKNNAVGLARAVKANHAIDAAATQIPAAILVSEVEGRRIHVLTAVALCMTSLFSVGLLSLRAIRARSSAFL